MATLFSWRSSCIFAQSVLAATLLSGCFDIQHEAASGPDEVIAQASQSSSAPSMNLGEGFDPTDTVSAGDGPTGNTCIRSDFGVE